MANSPQARKRARQAVTRRSRNMSRRSQLATYRKKFAAAIESKDLEASKTCFLALQQLIDRHSTKGLVHKNTAARVKSRANAKLKALALAA